MIRKPWAIFIFAQTFGDFLSKCQDCWSPHFTMNPLVVALLGVLRGKARAHTASWLQSPDQEPARDPKRCLVQPGTGRKTRGALRPGLRPPLEEPRPVRGAGRGCVKRSPGNTGGAAFERKRGANQDVRGKPFSWRGWRGRHAHFPFLCAPGPAFRRGPGDRRVPPRSSRVRRTAPKRSLGGPHAGLAPERRWAWPFRPGSELSASPRPALDEPGLA